MASRSGAAMASDTCPDCHDLDLRLRQATEAREADGPPVYIAAPYRGDGTIPIETNVTLAMAAFRALADLDIDAECPHVSFYLDPYNHRGDEWWLRHTMRKMLACTHVLRLGSVSSGADAEVARAHERKIPVFHSVKDLRQALGK